MEEEDNTESQVHDPVGEEDAGYEVEPFGVVDRGISLQQLQQEQAEGFSSKHAWLELENAKETKATIGVAKDQGWTHAKKEMHFIMRWFPNLLHRKRRKRQWSWIKRDLRKLSGPHTLVLYVVQALVVWHSFGECFQNRGLESNDHSQPIRNQTYSLPELLHATHASGGTEELYSEEKRGDASINVAPRIPSLLLGIIFCLFFVVN